MRKSLLLLLSLLVWLSSGCSLADKESRRLTAWMDKRMAPENPIAAKCLLPISIPVSIVTVTLDAVIVNPACNTVGSGKTIAYMYQDRGLPFFTKALIVPGVLVTVPPIFVVDWMCRNFVGPSLSPHMNALAEAAKIKEELGQSLLDMGYTKEDVKRIVEEELASEEKKMADEAKAEIEKAKAEKKKKEVQP